MVRRTLQELGELSEQSLQDVLPQDEAAAGTAPAGALDRSLSPWHEGDQPLLHKDDRNLQAPCADDAADEPLDQARHHTQIADGNLNMPVRTSSGPPPDAQLSSPLDTVSCPPLRTLCCC
jgi:hypothetical protein